MSGLLFDREGLSQTPVGNGDRMMLPFYEPEITPRMDTGGPVYSWEDRGANESVRAVLECQVSQHESSLKLARGHSRSDFIDRGSIGKRRNCADGGECLRVSGGATSKFLARLVLGAAMRAAQALGCDLAALEGTIFPTERGVQRLNLSPECPKCMMK